MIRVATVNAGTVPVLTPTAAAFRLLHPDTRVELIGAQETEIHAGLLEGRFDLGLTTSLTGDDPHPELETVTLVRGRPAVCIRTDSPLAELTEVNVSRLLSEPMILMRSGYLMHRYVHRLLRGQEPGVLHGRWWGYGQAARCRGSRCNDPARFQHHRRPPRPSQHDHLATLGRRQHRGAPHAAAPPSRHPSRRGTRPTPPLIEHSDGYELAGRAQPPRSRTPPLARALCERQLRRPPRPRCGCARRACGRATAHL